MADRYEIRLPALKIRQGSRPSTPSASTASGFTSLRQSVVYTATTHNFRDTSALKSSATSARYVGTSNLMEQCSRTPWCSRSTSESVS